MTIVLNIVQYAAPVMIVVEPFSGLDVLLGANTYSIFLIKFCILKHKEIVIPKKCHRGETSIWKH